GADGGEGPGESHQDNPPALDIGAQGHALDRRAAGPGERDVRDPMTNLNLGVHVEARGHAGLASCASSLDPVITDDGRRWRGAQPSSNLAQPTCCSVAGQEGCRTILTFWVNIVMIRGW